MAGLLFGAARVSLVPVLNGDDDAHDYQPTAQDARNVADADLIFIDGIGLETWMDRLAQNAGRCPRVRLGDESGIPVRPGDEREPPGDPHVWFDPTNCSGWWSRSAMRWRPWNRRGSKYSANAAAYNAELDQLDMDIKTMWAPIPSDQRKLVTNHDAFGYYVARYELVFVGSVIPSLSTVSEPSAAETQQLIQNIRAQGVRATFTESSVNPRLAEQIVGGGVRIFSNLYGDSLGKPGSDGDTYIKMMRFDTQTMISGITG